MTAVPLPPVDTPRAVSDVSAARWLGLETGLHGRNVTQTKSLALILGELWSGGTLTDFDYLKIPNLKNKQFAWRIGIFKNHAICDSCQ